VSNCHSLLLASIVCPPTQNVVVGAVPAPPGQSSSVVELSLEY